MKREELLRTKEYWMVQVQGNLFEAMQNFMTKEGINKTQLADKLNVTKSYVTQVFNGDFDHKISKMVELALACDKVPLINFVDVDAYISVDSRNKVYDLVPMVRPSLMTFEKSKSYIVDASAATSFNSNTKTVAPKFNGAYEI